MAGASAALIPPRTSVLPPGAGNEEPEKVLKADEKRANKPEQGYVRGLEIAQGHVHAPAIGRHDDGDGMAIVTVEDAQATWLPCSRRRRVRAV